MFDFSKRTLTSFNLSIGTGLMFESVFSPVEERYDKDRPIPNEVKADNYDYHLINLLTISRNIVESFPIKLEVDAVLKDKGFKECLQDEINIISSLYSNTSCVPVFYLPNYEKLKKIYNEKKNRDETVPVENFTKIYKKLKSFNMNKDFIADEGILVDITKLPRFKSTEKILITTNFAIDLMSPNSLSLLDSHTGVLYDKDKFYRKYNSIGSKDMSVFPMSEYLLYLIGDTTMSMIIDAKTRLTVYSIALENNWNQKTSDYKIKTGLMSDPNLRSHLTKFTPVY